MSQLLSARLSIPSHLFVLLSQPNAAHFASKCRWNTIFFTTILYPSVTGLSWDSGQVTTAYKRSACLKPKQIITGYITNLWIKFSVWIWDFRLGPNIPKKPCFFGTNFSPMPVNKSTVQVKREHLMQKGKKHIFDCWFGAGSNGPKPLEESSQHQLGAASWQGLLGRPLPAGTQSLD